MSKHATRVRPACSHPSHSFTSLDAPQVDASASVAARRAACTLHLSAHMADEACMSEWSDYDGDDDAAYENDLSSYFSWQDALPDAGSAVVVPSDAAAAEGGASTFRQREFCSRFPECSVAFPPVPRGPDQPHLPQRPSSVGLRCQGGRQRMIGGGASDDRR